MFSPRLLIIFTLIFFIAFKAFAQSDQLEILVINPENESLPGATIQLFNAAS
ncbi:MAG: hypothetical protein IPH88_16660, partial [Bacteroidales bacterium]|nr:hypothetical protein [Bacteroidales bacterium]